jgi:hypothetical protein
LDGRLEEFEKEQLEERKNSKIKNLLFGEVQQEDIDAE